MTEITVYDPPMCCATGVCGAEVDQRLVSFAADIDWLKAQGVTVRRVNLAREPLAFVEEPQIAALMARSEGDALPVVMVDGRIVAEARYPKRAELAGLAGLSLETAPAPRAKSGCGCGPAGGAGSNNCC